MTSQIRGIERRIEIVACIEQHMALTGRPPTMDEIRHGVGLASRSSVAHHLNVLADQGVIVKTPGGVSVLAGPVCAHCGGTGRTPDAPEGPDEPATDESHRREWAAAGDAL